MPNTEPIRRKGIKLGTRRSFEEVEFNESPNIIRENFPTHRTLHLIPEEGINQTGERVEIVVTEEVFLATADHVARDTSKESGGFLLGNPYECPNTNRSYIVIDQYMEAEYTEGTQVSLTFTTNSWAQLKDRLDGKYRGKQLVGWYHSHPGMGIFLSNYDLDIHRNRFPSEWDVALVIDPIKHEGGFFGWVNGNINPHEKLDFYELLEGDSRDSAVAWINYTPQDPKTGAATGLKDKNTKSFVLEEGINGNNNGATGRIPTTTTKNSSKSDLLTNPYVLIGGAAGLLILLLSAVIAVYSIFAGDNENNNSNANQDSEFISNEFLDKDRIFVNKNMEGYVSETDQNFRIKLNITGIGNPQVIEEIKRDNKVSITVNSQPAVIAESQIDNGAILKLRADTPLSLEEIESFKAGDVKNLKITVDILYRDDLVSKTLETKYQKTDKSDSLGTRVDFSGGVTERNEKVTKKQAEQKRNEISKPTVQTPKDNNSGKTVTSTKSEDKKTNVKDTSTQGAVKDDKSNGSTKRKDEDEVEKKPAQQDKQLTKPAKGETKREDEETKKNSRNNTQKQDNNITKTVKDLGNKVKNKARQMVKP